MGAINFNDVYADAYVRESVEVVTELQVSKYPVLATFKEDIKQELWIYIANAVEQFDPKRGVALNTFLRNVIDKRVINICQHFVSANDLFAGINHPVDEDALVFARENVTLTDLRMDLAVVMERLTPTQRQICQWIMDGVSMKGIARRLKIPYSSLFYFYIDDIRNEFRKEKMEKYLENL